jgi:opacity protein-like surface antigen
MILSRGRSRGDFERLISQSGNCIPNAEIMDRKFNIMKKYHSIAAGICAGALCAGAAHADSKFYVGADVGGALTGDVRVKEFLGPVSPGTKAQLDPGIRFAIHGGYKLTDCFSIEAETGVTGNNIKGITGASIDGDATLANVPFLLNARFQVPHGKCPITPYFGGGAGGSASVLGFENHIDFNGSRLRGSEADVVFAYQAFGGLRYAINDRMGVGVEYHYFATTGPSWSASGVGSPDKIGFAGVQTHAITAAFDFRF